MGFPKGKPWKPLLKHTYLYIPYESYTDVTTNIVGRRMEIFHYETCSCGTGSP